MGPEKLNVFRFSDYGMKSYGNGLVANPKSMAEHPDAMKAFVKASTRGWIEVMADLQAGAVAVKAREPLADQTLEFERLKLIVDGSMRTPRYARATAGAPPPRRACRPLSTRRSASLRDETRPDRGGHLDRPVPAGPGGPQAQGVSPGGHPAIHPPLPRSTRPRAPRAAGHAP